MGVQTRIILQRLPKAGGTLCAAVLLGALLTGSVYAQSDSAAAWNLCVTSYNRGQVDAALAACRQAIAADPMRVDAYFIVGMLGVAQAKTVGGKTVAPPWASVALQKYLDLAPNGSHAMDVKAALDFIK